jgi:hypothetical protein
MPRWNDRHNYNYPPQLIVKNGKSIMNKKIIVIAGGTIIATRITAYLLSHSPKERLNGTLREQRGYANDWDW